MTGQDEFGTEDPSRSLSARLSRRQLLVGAGLTSFGLLIAACSGDDDGESASDESEAPGTSAVLSEGPPLKRGLAEGNWGGPTGFDGAERYQYEFDSEEGRAIRGLRRLAQDGATPEELVLQVVGDVESQLVEPYPGGGPSLAQLFEEETGIKIRTVPTNPEANLTDNLQAISDQDGSFDVVQTTTADIGELAFGGLLLSLDEYVAKHEPSWSHPILGYVGGDRVVRLLNSWGGSFYVVAIDNRTLPFAYRADLFADPRERSAFEDRFGRPLQFPRTWQEHDEVAAFFTRKELESPLYGDIGLRSPVWQIANWQQRFVSSAEPNMFYFNDDGSANIAGEAGIRATEEHVAAAEWGGPNVLTDIWLDQFASFGACTGATGSSLPSITKTLPGNAELDTGGCGQFIATELPPGHAHQEGLVRRPVFFFNLSWGVNAFADPARHEPAYLFLQWVGSARVHAWLTSRPDASLSPLHAFSFDDPGVRASYNRGAENGRGESPAEVLRRITLFTAPPVTVPGAVEYTGVLDLELQKALTGQKPPEQAIRDAADEWNRITERIGLEQQLPAIQATRALWPSATEPL